jgi:hypothetical protein
VFGDFAGRADGRTADVAQPLLGAWHRVVAEHLVPGGLQVVCYGKAHDACANDTNIFQHCICQSRSLLRMGKEYALRLEHVPEKWKPVFRKGHATTYRAALHRRTGRLEFIEIQTNDLGKGGMQPFAG